MALPTLAVLSACLSRAKQSWNALWIPTHTNGWSGGSCMQMQTNVTLFYQHGVYVGSVWRQINIYEAFPYYANLIIYPESMLFPPPVFPKNVCPPSILLPSPST